MTLSIDTLSIDTATRCSCGAHVRITNGPGYAGKIFLALCPDCYDGTDDAGERAHVQGWGDSTDEALWAWQDAHDEAWEVEWHLADLPGEIARQVSEEAERQRSLGMRLIEGDVPIVMLRGPVLPLYYQSTR